MREREREGERETRREYAYFFYSRSSTAQLKPLAEATPITATASLKELCCALYDYESSEPGDLQFKSGDIIEVKNFAGPQKFFDLPKFLSPQVSSKEGDWWKGILNGKNGAFPCNYVEPHVVEEARIPSPSSSLPSRSSAVPPSPSPSVTSLASDVSVTTHAKPLVARVTQQYEAANDGELSLKTGQYVKVIGCT